MQLFHWLTLWECAAFLTGSNGTTFFETNWHFSSKPCLKQRGDHRHQLRKGYYEKHVKLACILGSLQNKTFQYQQTIKEKQNKERQADEYLLGRKVSWVSLSFTVSPEEILCSPRFMSCAIGGKDNRHLIYLFPIVKQVLVGILGLRISINL